MNYDDILSLSCRLSQFSAHELTTAWKEVLADEAVCSIVSRLQVTNWQESLRQSSEDPTRYWANYLQSRPDGRECADLLMQKIQEMLDLRTEVAASSHSSRVLRHILFNFVMDCNAVPSFLFISDRICTVNYLDSCRHGGFSHVYSGVLDDHIQVAIKRLHVRRHDTDYFIEELRREALIWRQLNHLHIVPFLGLAYIAQLNTDICMVSPWMSGGSLGLRLTEQPGIQGHDKARWIRQVCSGLRYLHEMGIIHGDLRGANILLDTKNNACITDFGISQLMDADDITMNMTNRTGAIRWMAPEVLENEECSYASDVYSFACTCLEILTQKRPLHEIKEDCAFKKDLREGNRPTWPTASTGNRTLDSVGSWIEAGFSRDPTGRPTMDQLYYSFGKIGCPPSNSTDSANVTESPLMRDYLMEIVAATVLESHPNVRRIENTYRQCQCEATFDTWIRCCQSIEDGEQLADAFLCEMQQMLDQPGPGLTEGDLWLLRRTMMKFSIKTQVIPSALFLDDAQCQESNPRGGGGFGDVFYGQLGSQAVALKRLRLSQTTNKDRYYKYLCKEALLWRQLRHPSVLAFLGLKGHTSEGPVYMISPWMAHDSISKYIQNQHTTVSSPLKRRWLFEIADGLSYLHDNGVIHADLRGANILLDEQNHAHLADFGLAKFADAGLSTLGMSAWHSGAPRWMPPEVLRGGECTFASDVYSYASTCLEIVSGTPPFSDIQMDIQVMLQVHAGSLFPTWPYVDYPELDDVGFLVTPAWNANPESRPRIAQLRDTMA